MAPLDGALYANLVRAVSEGGQQTLATVLDASLLPSDCSASVAPSTPNGTPTQNITACQPGVWVQATGDSLQIDGTPGLHSTAFGLLGGFDAPIGDAFHAGIEAGVNQLNGNDAWGGRGTVNSGHAGLYTFGDAGPLVLSATLDGGHANDLVDRQTGVGHASSHLDGNTYAGGVQVAWPVQADTWSVVPKAGVLYQHQSMDGFAETISGTSPLAPAYAINGARSTYITLQPYTGVNFTRAFQSGEMTYVPSLEAGYRYDTRSSVPNIIATAQDGTMFVLPGNAMGRGLTTAGARITAQAHSWQVFLDYSGAFASGLRDNALTFGFSKQF